MPPTSLRLPTLLLCLSLFLFPLWAASSPASAQDVNNVTLHVGPNQLRGGIVTNPSCANGACPSLTTNCGTIGSVIPCLTESNYSAVTTFTENNVHPGSNTQWCTDQAGQGLSNFSIEQRFAGNQPHAIDTVHVNVDENNGCMTIFGLTTPGPTVDKATTDKVFLFNSGNLTTTNADVWVNFSTQTLYGIFVRFGQTCCGGSGVTVTASIHQWEAFGKNETTYPLALAQADAMSAQATSLGANGSAPSYGGTTTDENGNAKTLGPGAYTIFMAMPVNLSTGYPIPWRDYTGVDGGYSPLGLEENGAKGVNAPAAQACAIQALNVSVASTQSLTFVVSTSANVCSLTNQFLAGSAYSSDVDAYVTGSLSSWNSTHALDFIGVVERSAGYPQNAISDSWLSLVGTGSGATGIFDPMVSGVADSGTVVFPNAGSNLVTVNLSNPWASSLSSIPFAGGGLYTILTQATTDSTVMTNAVLLVNGHPTQAVAQGSVGGIQWGLFELDDAAARNSLFNGNGSIMEGNLRPFSSESYVLSLGSGWKPAINVDAGSLNAVPGHVGLSCIRENVTLCSTDQQVSTFTIPQNVTNQVTFIVNDTSANPIAQANVLLTNTTATQATSAGGAAIFANVFSYSHFIVSKPGYVSVCADFIWTNTGTIATGTASDGCVFVKAGNALFTVTLLTTAQGGVGSTGGAGVGGFGPTITCTPASTSVTIPSIVNFTWTHATSEAESYVFFKAQTNGIPQEVSGAFSLPGGASTGYITYPLGRNATQESPVLNDTGQYFLQFYNASGAETQTCPFAINGADTAFNPPLPDTNTLGVIQNVINALVTTSAASSGVAGVATPQDVQSLVLSGTKWFYNIGVFLPNGYWFLLFCMVLAFFRLIQLREERP
jgi:hypothetical protein